MLVRCIYLDGMLGTQFALFGNVRLHMSGGSELQYCLRFLTGILVHPFVQLVRV
jgi:hypothetical protein